ncbi:hypothetical protein [Caldiplasma sukawensis]
MNYPDINLLFAGSTHLSKINGITEAGADSELTFLTPVVDSEISLYGRPLTINFPPITPDGIPSPSVVSYACFKIVGIKTMIVNSGMEKRPKTPFFETGLLPSLNPLETYSCPDYEKAKMAAIEIVNIFDSREEILISESIPAGTTSALIMLNKIIGIEKVSSSMKISPDEEKLNIAKRVNSKIPDNLSSEELIKRAGDYTHAMIYNIIKYRRKKIILGGGTQMAAIIALCNRDSIDTSNTTLITTDLVFNSVGNEFFKKCGVKNFEIADTFFEKSSHEGLRKYSEGSVKEGVGLGASIHFASKITENKNIIGEIDNVYEKILHL